MAVALAVVGYRRFAAFGATTTASGVRISWLMVARNSD